MTMIEYIRTFVGIAPVGFEYLEYTFAGIFLMLLIRFVADLFRNAASWLNLRR